ncbi:MAG: sulfatase-like hydrolase/transferase [Verrucomicrobiota bacterium]
MPARTHSLLWLALGLLMLPLGAKERPNIIVIMTDDSGISDLGSYGGEIDTPHLDRLAEGGMRMSDFYTNGRCSPSRASMLTGMESAKVGFGGGALGDWARQFREPAHRGRLPYDTPTLPELLKQAGYRTLMTGKWHLGGSDIRKDPAGRREWKKDHPGWELTEDEIEAEFQAMPVNRGFDQYFGILHAQDKLFFLEGDKHQYTEGIGPATLSFEQEFTMHCYLKEKRYNEHHGKTAKAFHDTDGITERALEMIEESEGEEDVPFFLYVAYRAPHKPLQAPEELVQKYLKRYQDLDQIAADRRKGMVEEGFFPKGAKQRGPWQPKNKEALEDFRLQLAIHAAMTERIDHGVGTLLKGLEEKGELENTLIFYLSDNGCASHVVGFMNTPLHGSKALVWEGGLKTHLIASWPGVIPPGSISHDQGWIGDLFTTSLEVAGVPYPERFRGKATSQPDGRSLIPLLKGGTLPPRENLFFNDKGQQAVIHQGRWKLLIEPGWYLQTKEKPGIAYELYDLQADPGETNNLAGSKPKLVKKLEALCQAWVKESGIVDYEDRLKIRPRDPF